MAVQGLAAFFKDKLGNYKFPYTIAKLVWMGEERLDNIITGLRSKDTYLENKILNSAEYGYTDAVSGSVAASTWTQLQSVTLTKGTYILTGKMQVPPSGTGGAFALRFGHELGAEYVSQVYHSTVGMAVEKTSHIVVGDEPVTVTLQGWSTILSNYQSVRIRWIKIRRD